MTFASLQPISRGTRKRSEGILDFGVQTSVGPVRVYCRRQLRSAPGRFAPEGVLGFKALCLFSMHSLFLFLVFILCFYSCMLSTLAVAN